MRTVVVSDLHLAAGHGADLIRRAAFRERLWPALEGADRVVLLGDVIELRDRPLAEAVAAAQPFFEELGEVLGAGQVLLVPGNHDHHLLNGWLERRRLAGGRPLALEQTAKPPAGVLSAIGRMLGDAELVLAYPGIRLGEGVYATHGHYLDAHLTVPTFERLGVGTMERLLGGLPAAGRTPDDYERAQAPLYDFLYALAQAGGTGGRFAGASPSARIWTALSGTGGPAARVRGLLLGAVALPGAVGVANRLGIGRFRADLSLEEIGRAGVSAMGEVVRHLGIEAEHLVFGHTHRRGPLPEEQEWIAPGGARLLNTGSWVHSPALLGPSAEESPYWPGTVAVIEDSGPPELRHLLDELTHEDLAAE
jgi:hypothetical protein